MNDIDHRPERPASGKRVIPRYAVTILRTIQQSVTIEVEADTGKAARELVFEQMRQHAFPPQSFRDDPNYPETVKIVATQRTNEGERFVGDYPKG